MSPVEHKNTHGSVTTANSSCLPQSHKDDNSDTERFAFSNEDVRSFAMTAGITPVVVVESNFAILRTL